MKRTINVPQGGITLHEARELQRRLFSENTSEQEMAAKMVVGLDPVVNRVFKKMVQDTEVVRSKFPKDYIEKNPWFSFEKIREEMRQDDLKGTVSAEQREYDKEIFMHCYEFWGTFFKDHDFITPKFEYNFTEEFEIYD